MRFATSLGSLLIVACSAPPQSSHSAVDGVHSSGTVPSATVVSATPPEAAPPEAASASAPSTPRLRTLISGARFDNPTPMVVDETNVYVSSGGILLYVPKDGSAFPKPVFPKTQIVSVLAADATDLYVGIYPADGPGPKGAIVRIDEKTQTSTEVVRTELLTSIAVDDQYVWFGLLSDGAYRVDKKGGKAKAVFTGRGQVGAITEDDENVYFGVTRYGSKQRAEIDVVKKKGGAFSTFSSDAYDLMGLVALPDALYANDNGVLKRFARAGGPPEKMSSAGSVVGLARRGAEVLFCDIVLTDTTRPAGVFFAGNPPELSSEAPGAVGIAVDDHTVYWADATLRTLTALDL